jgi:hypothetical protein
MKMHKKIVLLFISTVFTLGCHATEPPDTFHDKGIPDKAVTPDLPTGCENVTPLPAPTVSTFPDPSNNALQAFRGTAPGASMITAKSSAGEATPQSVDSQGNYCIEARLIEDAPNTVTFIALDSNGCPGEKKVVSITHVKLADDAGVSSAPANVALGQPITSDSDIDQSDLQKINDGSDSSWTEISFWDFDISSTCDKFSWVRIDLGKVYTVSAAKIRWDSSATGQYGTCYTLLLSSSSSPSAPDPTSTDWTVAFQTESATNGEQNISVTPKSARFAALLLYENAQTDLDLQESFYLAEFEVWGQDPDITPPPPPDRCSNGN